MSLVTEGITCITENGIQTIDGNIYEVDIIVYATGFSPLLSTTGFSAFGERKKANTMQNGLQETDGEDTTKIQMNDLLQNKRLCLKDEWGDEPNAYLGINYPGFPNAFFMLGPHTTLGHSSVIVMIECQITYIKDCIEKVIKGNIKSIDVKHTANERFQIWVKEQMKNKVFALSSCSSWYKNKKGVNWVLWPSHLAKYWWMTRKVNLDDYKHYY